MPPISGTSCDYQANDVLYCYRMRLPGDNGSGCCSQVDTLRACGGASALYDIIYPYNSTIGYALTFVCPMSTPGPSPSPAPPACAAPIPNVFAHRTETGAPGSTTAMTTQDNCATLTCLFKARTIRGVDYYAISEFGPTQVSYEPCGSTVASNRR